MKNFVSILALFLAASVIPTSTTQTKWDNLRVKWSMRPTNETFVVLPRRSREAEKEGWTKVSECTSSTQWRGQRYVLNNDYAVVLLYDVNGFIAGIQSTVPKGGSYPPTTLRPPFVRDGNRWAITAYFVDPGYNHLYNRPHPTGNQQGTGTNLYFQNSTNPFSSVMIPRTEAGIERTSWIKGKCFWLMGLHYWHNMGLNSNCDKAFPAFVLYTDHKLRAFGWAFLANMTSPRFEPVPPTSYKYFIDPVPTCMNTRVMSSMHIFLTTENDMTCGPPQQGK
ncbi:uncharacterized protein LOC131957994 [Physella acuta]|uniref:uncharacterized protein LOC131957994 n=1 Tax=Physella acuta TaxID=109671 RepID=UPI0027DC3D9B|nr:uncharacterized protein LOC131957994 [Physella acuta]